MIRRRMFTAGLSACLAAPSISRGAANKALKFIPQSDLTILDPIVTTVYTARNHGFMVFDTLFGMDSNYRMQPQMLDSVLVEDDGKRWKLKLRDGLLWHDGEKVRARDCVASIRRWAVRDGIGSLLMKRTDELAAIDDQTIQFRLSKPFSMLPYALGKISTPMCAMMPERLAKTDPFKVVSEMVGSGPFRFKADEWISGARAVYTKFDRYVPRAEISTGWTAGGKVVHLERVEWLTSPDDGTSASAMQSGEMDWWELPTADLLPLLKRTGKIRIEIKDRNGTLGLLKMNNLQPPFNNPAIRRALLGAVVQADYMTAIAGDDPTMWRAGVGIFTPGTDMATDAGMDVLNSKRDLARVRAAIVEAGYKDEKTVLLAPSEPNYRKAMADVSAGMMKAVGLNLEIQSMDWGTAIVRRENKQPVDKGGWSALSTTANGLDMQTPLLHFLRATGENAWFGWTNSPRIEELRAAWVDAPDLAAQKQIAADIQRQCWIDVPHLPLGLWYQPMAWQNTIDGIPDGFPLFWGVRWV
ncbi:MAG: peptide/nickel transport system substrate-binding protein [Acetobacteraceae bacterium]|nr:peptide/nickel transport system substrate-binding protein [Acetobacteraceae bacterium]